ncbi:MAG: hypothetical protein WAV40_04695 [Microgenomates group bacterium]
MKSIKAGIKDLRTNLAKYLNEVRTSNSIVFITRVDKPIAGVMGIDQISRLAEQAKDNELIREISLAKKDSKVVFANRKDATIDLINRTIEGVAQDGGMEEIIKNLENLRYFVEHFISDESSGNEMLLYETRKRIEPYFQMLLEKDYYNITQEFKELLEKAILKMSEQLVHAKSKMVVNNLEQLTDLLKNSKIHVIKSPRRSNNYSSVLVSIWDKGEYKTHKIYTLISRKYVGKNMLPNFIDPDDRMWPHLLSAKVGDRFKSVGHEYVVEGIT